MLFIYGCVHLCGGTRPIICILGIFAGALSGWLGWALLGYWGSRRYYLRPMKVKLGNNPINSIGCLNQACFHDSI